MSVPFHNKWKNFFKKHWPPIFCSITAYRAYLHIIHYILYHSLKIHIIKHVRKSLVWRFPEHIRVCLLYRQKVCLCDEIWEALSFQPTVPEIPSISYPWGSMKHLRSLFKMHIWKRKHNNTCINFLKCCINWFIVNNNPKELNLEEVNFDRSGDDFDHKNYWTATKNWLNARVCKNLIFISLIPSFLQ